MISNAKVQIKPTKLFSELFMLRHGKGVGNIPCVVVTELQDVVILAIHTQPVTIRQVCPVEGTEADKTPTLVGLGKAVSPKPHGRDGEDGGEEGKSPHFGFPAEVS